jgi:uncharacterized UBP type Zn finger protein
MDTGNRHKVCDKVEYGAQLTASQVKEIMNFGRPQGKEWAGDETRGEGGGSGAGGYDLFAVLVHIGGTQGGHYIAYIRPEAGGKWVEFNDCVVREVEEAAVLACCGCDPAGVPNVLLMCC